MTLPRCLPYFLCLAVSSVLRAEIKLHGLMQVGGRGVAALVDSADSATPQWTAVGGTFRGYTLVSYDVAHESVHLRKEGHEIELTLAGSRVMSGRAAPLDLRTVGDDELRALGLQRTRRGATGSSIAEEAGITLAELVAFNPGVRFDRLKVGQLIAIARDAAGAPPLSAAPPPTATPTAPTTSQP